MQITEYTVIKQLEENNVAIALLADMHGKSFETVSNYIKHHKPDYIAIVGDIIAHDNDKYPFNFFEFCAKTTLTFFSLGNHERKISENQLSAIKNTGVVVLDNTWFKSGTLVFGGMTSAFVTEWRNTRQTVLRYANPDCYWLDEYVKQDGFHILLDHHPENYERITKKKNIDLILSGHAHGGQIRVFNQGLYAPHQGILPKYTSGVYDNRLIVSRGLANLNHIPRIGNPTELVYVRIQNGTAL